MDCILNSEVDAEALLPGLVKGPAGTPAALSTAFGWVLMGASGKRGDSSGYAAPHLVTVDHELTKFWETEDVPSSSRLTHEEQACWDHFNQTCTRNDERRFVVRLPFLKPPSVTDTQRIAKTNFRRLERRFCKEPDLVKAYVAFMEEYRELGHMEVVPPDKVMKSDPYYFAHQPVFKKDASKKIRVVLNASQLNAEGVSHNSLLHIGPKLQVDILILITRWSFLSVISRVMS